MKLLQLSISVPMIIGEIRRYLRDNSTLRISRTIKDIAYKALKIREANSQKEYTNDEIAKMLEITPALLEEAIKAVCEPYSLYDPIYNESGDKSVIMDQIKDETNNEYGWIEELALNEAIAKLESREKNVISLRYYHGKTQTQVADEIGISQAQVSRIEKCALSSLKNGFELQ